MPSNKGFKGIDKRAYVAPNYDSRKSGRQDISGHNDRRTNNNDAALQAGHTTYQLKAEDWQRMGVSASYTSESGSKLFHSPDTNFGASWSERPVWSNTTVKVRGWKSKDDYASISFRMGNCCNGNVNGSWYGMGGAGPWSSMHRSLLGTTTPPEGFTPTPQNFPTTYTPMVGFWASANNKLLCQINGANQGTINPCNEGDKIEIRFYSNGVIEYWHNDAKFLTPLYNAKLDLSQLLDDEFTITFQSNQEGASGNYMVYDVQMKGVITNHTAEGGICYSRFKTQFEQTMLPISTSFESGSYSGLLPEMSTSPDSGSCVIFKGGAYSTPIWSNQFITGSGRGGIITMQYPSSSPDFGNMGEIVGLADHTQVTGYNYYTQVCTVRTDALTWGADTPGTNQKVAAWYSWNAAGTGNGSTHRTGGGNRQPVTSGSKYAWVVTGSEDIKMTGGTNFDDGGATDGAQISSLLMKIVDTTDSPINDYVSGNWMTMTTTPYSVASTGRGPKKLIFNDGNTTNGCHYCEIKIGDNYVASGSV